MSKTSQFKKRCLYIPIKPEDEEDPKGPNNRPGWDGPTIDSWSAYKEDGIKNLYTWEERQESDWDRWGIVGWSGSEKLLIVDIDAYKFEDDEEKKKVLGAGLKDTRIHKSQSGGFHVFYLVKPENLDADFDEDGEAKPKMPVKLGKHIDDKLNGYVLDPCCDGYEIVNEVMPTKIDPKKDLPSEWLKETSSPQQKKVDLDDDELRERHRIAIEEDDDFRMLYNGQYSEAGFKNDRSAAESALASRIGFWFGRDKEIIKKIMNKSAAKKWHERTDHGYRNSILNVGVQGEDVFELNQHDELEECWETVNELYESSEKGSTGEANHLAMRLLEDEYEIVAIEESGVVYYYDKEAGYYKRNGERFIKSLIEEKLGEESNKNRKTEIKEKWIDRNYIKVNSFEPPEGKVNVKNGVLDLDTCELEEHTPEYYFTSQLNVEYEPGIDDDLWIDQAERAIDDPRDVKKLEEYIAYTLEDWHHKYEKSLFLVGPSRTGKSTIQEGIKALFDTEGSVSSLTPQQIADTNFDAFMLFDAMLNTVNDINSTKIKDSGALKRIFSGESTKIEQKYKDPFSAEPTAKHLFTCNWTPKIKGHDEAIWRRVMIIIMSDQVSQDEKDPEIKMRFKEDEKIRQTILNRALEARKRLKERNRFTNDRTVDGTRDMWESWQNSNKRYIYTNFKITYDPEDKVSKKEYMRKYNEFCKENKYQPKSKREVTMEIQYMAGIGTEEKHYSGLVLKDEREKEEDDNVDITEDWTNESLKGSIMDVAQNNEFVYLDDIKNVVNASTSEIEKELNRLNDEEGVFKKVEPGVYEVMT